MRNYKILVVFLLAIVAFPALALDPVAPKSERRYGQIAVHTPLPSSDTCQIVAKSGSFQQSFKPEETVKVPVGDYTVKVKLQDQDWSKNITIHPTERTDVFVTGFGNLKVSSPDPTLDVVEVLDQSGKQVANFHPNMVKTLPVGNYSVIVKMKLSRRKNTQVRQDNVSIMTNATREIVASLE